MAAVDPNAPLALGGLVIVGATIDPNADAPVYSEAYHPYIVKFARTLFPNQFINSTSRFRPSSFAGVTPHLVRNYICNQTYGKEVLTATDYPIHWRSSTAEQAKKAISFYMPQSQPSWNPATNSGNPTKSKDVNDLIKRIKKDEVRKLGKFHVSILTCVCWYLLFPICLYSNLVSLLSCA